MKQKKIHKGFFCECDKIKTRKIMEKFKKRSLKIKTNNRNPKKYHE